MTRTGTTRTAAGRALEGRELASRAATYEAIATVTMMSPHPLPESASGVINSHLTAAAEAIERGVNKRARKLALRPHTVTGS